MLPVDKQAITIKSPTLIYLIADVVLYLVARPNLENVSNMVISMDGNLFNFNEK